MCISFSVCMNKGVELHLLGDRICAFLILIDVARYPCIHIYVCTFTIDEYRVPVSLHPVQV